MLNQYLIVGRIKELLPHSMVITADEPYRKDKKADIEVRFNGQNILNNVKEFTRINDIVGVKGYITVDNGLTILVADKVTFLSHDSRGGETNE